MEWEHEGKPPKSDDMREFQVWTGEEVRKVRRIGNRSPYFSPSVLVFTDCFSPLQNAICDESRIKAWRLPADAG